MILCSYVLENIKIQYKMCYSCEQKFQNEGELLQSLVNPKFVLWNGSSISHLILIFIGFNDEKCSKLASKLIDNYIKYKQEFPTNDDWFFGHPSAQSVIKLKESAQKLKPYVEKLSKQEQRALMFHQNIPHDLPCGILSDLLNDFYSKCI